MKRRAPDAPRDPDDGLARLIGVVSVSVAAVIALAVPGLYLFAAYGREASAVETLAHVKASLVGDVIDRNPQLWRYEESRLRAIVADRESASLGATASSVLDAERRVIARSSPGPLAQPVVREEVELRDAGRTVGHFIAERSLQGLVLETLLVAIASLAIALAIAFPLRTWPLRALERSRQRLVHMAHHDALTGLANRSLLDDRLRQALLRAQRHGRSVSVLFIDLDHFKLVNDSLGHHVGDALLQQVAERMRSIVRDTDTLARLGGDEFVIVLTDQPAASAPIMDAVQRIRSLLAAPLHVAGHALGVGFSIGVASSPTDGCDAPELLRHADVAMYRAKELGRNGVQFYTPDMNEKLLERTRLRQGLLEALDLGQLHLAYQPQADIATGAVVGVEALLRWQHPELGSVAPARFIPVAEETGLIVPIGLWVLRTACRQQVAWVRQGLPPVRMSVNVSARQFREASWVDDVAGVIAETGIAPAHLELELTESLIMENLERALSKMNALTAMGVQLSIDDFGTGYSNLSALRQFPVSRLKIDKSFVDGLPGSPNDQSIASAIIALGQRLNLKILAEGVETPEQQDFLRRNRCDEMQGFAFSRPVDADSVARMLVRGPAHAPAAVNAA